MNSPESTLLRGGCQCGAVRYEAAGRPYNRTLCHCTICRRTSGAPVVAWFSVETGRFRITQGQPRQFRSSARAVRAFCGDCGTPLTFKRDDLDEIDIATCSLDDPEAVPPEDHTYLRSRLGWLALCDDLPRFETARPEG